MDNNPDQAPTPPTSPEQPQKPFVVEQIQQAPEAQTYANDPTPPPQTDPSPQPFPTPAPVAPVVPAPAPAPQPFPVPATPVGSSPGGNYSPRSGPKLGLILGLIGGFIGLVILIVGGIFVATALLGVSKADYQTAYDTTSDLRDSYSDIGSVYISSYSTETEIKNGVDTITKAKDAVNENYEKLSNLKAIKSDSDVAVSFKKLSDKKPKFDTAMDATLEAYGEILPAISGISASSSSSTKLKQLRMGLEGLTGLKDQNNKDFVASMITTLTKLEVLAAKIQAGRNDYRLYDSSAVRSYYDAADDMSAAIKDWQSNLTKMGEEGELADEINDLGELITNKLNKK